MAEYRFILGDTSSGLALGEIPLTVTSFTYWLNAVGQLSGTIPRDHPMAQDIWWALYRSTNSDREITVLRDGLPVWNGPVTIMTASLQDHSQMQVTAREASWFLTKRTLEVDKNYLSNDYYTAARDLIGSYMVGKLSTAGDGTGSAGLTLNASLPRWSVAPSSGTSGFTIPSTNIPTYYGSARHLISEIVDSWIVDPTSPLDYRMDYTTGSTRLQCQRTFTLGAPLGATLTTPVDEYNLFDYDKTEDRERAGNRVHVISGADPVTLQNTASTANGDVLIEAVFNEQDATDTPTATSYARAYRRAAQPPVVADTASYVPGGATPWGWCQVGDIVPRNLQGHTILHSTGSVRVLQIEVNPLPELVTLTFGVALDALGT